MTTLARTRCCPAAQLQLPLRQKEGLEHRTLVQPAHVPPLHVPAAGHIRAVLGLRQMEPPAEQSMVLLDELQAAVPVGHVPRVRTQAPRRQTSLSRREQSSKTDDVVPQPVAASQVAA